MGKKIKKKARSLQKEKRVLPPSATKISQQCSGNAGTPENEGILLVKERGVCSHIDGGISLEKLSAKLASSEPLKCEDCRGNAMDRRSSKGKGKHGKKGGTNSKSDLKAIWICLECGHFSCGGIGFPTTPQSHAIRHAKQNHHPLAIQFENSQLLWCFNCNNLITAKKCKDDGEHEDTIHDVSKILKMRPSEASSINVENVLFGSGNGTSAVSDYPSSSRFDERAGYSVRGLINLGNTCFFNSIMQNLLALNKFRDFLFKLDESVGPLSASLRKVFLEAGAEASSGNAINPRSLFGCLCSKAPHFRGYQQHDSHELLRYLLDGLSSEELIARKKVKSSLADEVTSLADPSFVDTIFGGQLLSTVSCMECGHSSAIYEPFLDLSLCIPSKKNPSKQKQTVTWCKKPKVPPKRSGRIQSKVGTDMYLRSEFVSDQPTVGNSFSEVQSRLQLAEQFNTSSGDLAPSNSDDLKAAVADMGFKPQDLSGIQQSQNHELDDSAGEQLASSDILTWLDYLESNQGSSGISASSEIGEVSENHVSTSQNVFQNDVSLPINMDSNNGNNFVDTVLETSLDSASLFNSTEHGLLSQQRNVISQFEGTTTAVSQFDEKVSHDESLTMKLVQHDTDLVHSSESSGHVRLGNTNLDVRSSEIDSGQPSHIQASKVLPLPYTEEMTSVSSAVIDDEPGSLEFDGFGDLFNEPEASTQLGSSDNVSEPSGLIKDGFVGNSSDSDPCEIDNSDAPVSVESCLSFFIKPEHLSKNEHAWKCDNCSKILQERVSISRKLKMPIREMLSKGDNGNPNTLLNNGKNFSEPKITDGTVDSHVFNALNGRFPTHHMEIHDKGNFMVRNNLEMEMNAFPCQSENVMSMVINSHHGQSECSSFNNPNSCSGKFGTDIVRLPESNLLTAKSELLESEEEVDSNSFKVSRDATKTLFISKAPSILTIHLKRFSQDARGRLSKLNGHVAFREIINLKPYMNPRCISRESFTYRLVGAVEHIGSMRNGHYVAYVREGIKRFGESIWYYTSDAHIREASLEEVLRCEAYILFYEGT